jgi:hypothetical protein
LLVGGVRSQESGERRIKKEKKRRKVGEERRKKTRNRKEEGSRGINKLIYFFLLAPDRAQTLRPYLLLHSSFFILHSSF